MNHFDRPRRIVVGVSGASGAAYSVRVIQGLLSGGTEVHLVISKHGRRLLLEELDIKDITPESLGVPSFDKLVQHPVNDVGSVISSGSFLTDGMVICPCSSHTLGAIAAGLGENLIHRAAHVTIKEMRRLVIVPREMPMSRIDLVNSLRLNEAGAVICPAAPGFYLRPTTVEELVDFVAGKVLDLLDVPHDMQTRWTGEVPQEKTS